jgi:hypothetical protein
MSDIQHAIQIASKPETIYPLIATAEGLGQWWAADIPVHGRRRTGFFQPHNRLPPEAHRRSAARPGGLDLRDGPRVERHSHRLSAGKPRFWNTAALHPCRLAIRDRLLHFLQHDLG